VSALKFPSLSFLFFQLFSFFVRLVVVFSSTQGSRAEMERGEEGDSKEAQITFSQIIGRGICGIIFRGTTLQEKKKGKKKTK
jgi:hypothetical protein